MGSSLTVLALAALLAQPAEVPAGRVVTLTLPHLLRDGETAWIEVKLGVLERGQEIVITTAEGRFIGHLSPHGIPRGKEAGVYPVPVPADAISKGRVSLRLSIQQGDKQRAPTRSEVKNIRLKIMPAAPGK